VYSNETQAVLDNLKSCLKDMNIDVVKAHFVTDATSADAIGAVARELNHQFGLNYTRGTKTMPGSSS
jgi:hypothetical protein